MLNKKKLVITIVSGVITLLFAILTVVLFGFIPNYECNTAQHIMIIIGDVVCGAICVGCFMATMFSIFDDDGWF